MRGCKASLGSIPNIIRFIVVEEKNELAVISSLL